MPTFDVIVLGCGAMGSATLWRLAQRGLRCCGIEQFGIPHDRGSSHGDSRAIRKAYFEHPDYIPLLNRAYDLWDELQAEAHVTLKHDAGMLFSGTLDGAAIRGLERTYAEHQLPHERLTPADASKRFPLFRFRDEHIVFYDPLGGYVTPEATIAACTKLAEAAGATVLRHVPVTSWSADEKGVSVSTRHDVFRAHSLVITAGAWSRGVLERLNLPLRVLRKVLVWYTAPDVAALTNGFPVWFVDAPYGAVYGFPAHNGREFKVAVHSGGEEASGPDALDRTLHEDDEAAILQCLAETFPSIQPTRTRHAVCMYTVTPDENFILDLHPQHPNVAIAAGFSGHGFKFAPVIGDIMADLAQHQSTNYPIAFLRLDRFRDRLS